MTAAIAHLKSTGTGFLTVIKKISSGYLESGIQVWNQNGTDIFLIMRKYQLSICELLSVFKWLLSLTSVNPYPRSSIHNFVF